MSADLNIMSRLHHYSPDSSPLESLAAIAVSEPPALPSRHSSGPPLAVHLQQQHSPLLPTWLCTFSPVVNRWCVWVTWAAGSKNRASNLAQMHLSATGPHSNLQKVTLATQHFAGGSMLLGQWLLHQSLPRTVEGQGRDLAGLKGKNQEEVFVLWM